MCGSLRFEGGPTHPTSSGQGPTNTRTTSIAHPVCGCPTRQPHPRWAEKSRPPLRRRTLAGRRPGSHNIPGRGWEPRAGLRGPCPPDRRGPPWQHGGTVTVTTAPRRKRPNRQLRRHLAQTCQSRLGATAASGPGWAWQATDSPCLSARHAQAASDAQGPGRGRLGQVRSRCYMDLLLDVNDHEPKS